ncbi:hypothetical protein Csa_002977, partial [Cucumis sativus]
REKISQAIEAQALTTNLSSSVESLSRVTTWTAAKGAMCPLGPTPWANGCPARPPPRQRLLASHHLPAI